MIERKFLIELYTDTPRPEAYPIRYKSDELNLVAPKRSLAVISERKLDQLIKDGDMYQHFRIIQNRPLTDDEIKHMVYEEEIDPDKQIDHWAKPENRDKISPYDGAQTRSIDEKKGELLIQAGFDANDAYQSKMELSLDMDNKKHYRISGLEKWEDLNMTFTDDETVEIKLPGQESFRRGFNELGFKDNRNTDRPNVQWELLKKMAASDGILPLDNHDMTWNLRGRTEGRIRRLRKILQTTFELDQNPILKKRGKPYRCCFLLSAIPYVCEQFNTS